MKNSFAEILGLAFMVVAVVLIVVLLMGFPTMWLWNWLMPALFGLPVIGFWKAVGINLLSSILFKSTNVTKSK